MKLYEENKIKMTDEIIKFIPEMDNNDKKTI